MIAVRALPDLPELSTGLKVLNSSTTARYLLPYKVTFTGSRD